MAFGGGEEQVSRIIAIDLHDVCIAYVTALVNRLGWPAQWGERMISFWPNYDWQKHWREHEAFLAGLLPIAGAAEVLNSWASRHDCFYLTATNEKWRAVTTKWLEDNGFPSFHLVMTGTVEDKMKWFETTKGIVDYLIDDTAPVLRAAEGKVRELIVMDAPWNRTFSGGQRFRTWEEIARWVQ